MNKLSIRTLFLIYLAIISFVLFGITTLTFIKILEQNSIHSIDGRAKILSESIRIESGLVHSAERTVAEIIADRRLAEYLGSLAVEEVKEFGLYDTSTGKAFVFIGGEFRPAPVSEFSRRAATGSFVKVKNGPNIMFVVRLGTHVYLRLLLSFVEESRHLLKFIQLAASYLILDLIFIFIVGYFLVNRSIIRPVTEIDQAIERIASGNFKDKLKLSGFSEIENLKSSFNTMAETLRRNQEEIENKIGKLTEANTALKSAREEIIFGEKMASVGRLSAGIAHEIGNPLGIIMGYLEILETDAAIPIARQAKIAKIKREASRINDTIRNLLDYARPSKRENVDAAHLVEETVALCVHDKRLSGFSVKVNAEPGVGPVVCEADKIKQALINLIFNAADSYGTFTLDDSLRTIEVTVAKKEIEQTDYCTITVSDHGAGIEESIRDKIYDPFFTTKDVGKGTGLGLTVVFRVMDSIGGKVEIESRPGSGTDARLLIPYA